MRACRAFAARAHCLVPACRWFARCLFHLRPGRGLDADCDLPSLPPPTISSSRSRGQLATAPEQRAGVVMASASTETDTSCESSQSQAAEVELDDKSAGKNSGASSVRPLTSSPRPVKAAQRELKRRPTESEEVEEAHVLPSVYVSTVKFTPESRMNLYCDQILASCKVVTCKATLVGKEVHICLGGNQFHSPFLSK